MLDDIRNLIFSLMLELVNFILLNPYEIIRDDYICQAYERFIYKEITNKNLKYIESD